MQALLTLIQKEIRVYFASAIFPVAGCVFLFLTGFAFTASMTQVSPNNLPEASMRGMIYFMSLVLLFISPFLTMRSFSEEKKMGTIELLKTCPLSNFQIVLAKYLGVLFLFIFLLVLTVEFPVLIGIFGDPDWGVLLLSYLGLFLLGATLTAIGVFFSALTQSQMLSAVLSFVTTITLWFLGDVGGIWGEKISVITHLHSFTLGVIDTKDVAYYVLVSSIFVFLTFRVLEAERWK